MKTKHFLLSWTLGVLCVCSWVGAGTVVQKVPQPWTPVRTKDGTVSVWGRDYSFASNALPVRVTSGGRDLLAGPMRVVCADAAGKDLAWAKAGSWIQSADAESATVCGWQETPEVTADVSARVEFDGMMKVSLAVMPGPKSPRARTKKVWLEIPLRPEVAKLYCVSPASWSKLDNVGGVKGPMAWPFRCSVWIGDEKAGLCWFCESDENFSPASDDRVVELVPGANETTLRIRLAEKELELPATWTFGLQATPVKPWNRARNANHVLHSPQMGVGITIKRPEVWWTSQRAFPDGKIEESLDAAQKAGVKTIAFHEDWIPIQNNPAPRADFKAIVEGCHRRGMKVLVYQGYELSPLDPAWGDHHADYLSKEANGRYVSYWFREPGQRDYRVCYNNAFADEWLARAKRAYDALGIDGFYLDGTIMPRACANERHGCGWRDAQGRLHVSYPFFAVRRMMRQLYEFVDARGGMIDAHQSGYVCPATLAFAHSYWDGEQLACQKQDIRRTLDLDAFRAEFMGRNHGVPCEFLAYEIPGKWTYDDALALTLLHDVLVRPCGFVSVPRLSPVWKALDEFGITEADWLPYWENPLPVAPATVKASVYRRGGRFLAVVSNLSPDNAVTAEVTLPAGTVRATNAVTGEDVPVVDGRARVALGAFRMALLRYESPAVVLPGEDGTHAALSPAPFPDRLSAYVWRNWFVVPHDTLARVVGATPGQIAAMGAEMGLPANPSVLPEWRRKGYITVLRRNWHLLDYPQLLDLLGMTREELRFCLLEEDFLFVKLGNTKPTCEPLRYDAAAVAATAPARRRLAAVLKEEGIDAAAPEEPRFTFIHELSAPLPQSNNQTIKQSNNSSSPFDFRLIFSYFADYSDPLADPEVASYPEGLLQRLSLQGVNAVWLHTALRTLAKDPKYPEFGEGSENRIANLRKLVARAGKYGIRVFLYMNEPRGLPEDFFAARSERAALKGVNEGPRHAFCTSEPETLRWVRDSLTQVFASVPGLGGIFTITMSENLTHCASRGQKAKCPRCKDRSDAEIIAEINRTMIEGMVRGNPNAEALVWNWGWPKEEAQLKEIVAGLPRKNIRLMEVSENRMPFTRGGVACTVADYSISVVGPGESAKGFWHLARGAGLPCVAKVQANCTWELCSFPYLPVTELVAEHASNLAKEGVDGVMLSWSLGCCPAMNLRVFESIRKGETTKEPVLDRLASDLYGAAAAPAVRAAWHAFAEGFREYPFNIAVAYNGPQQWGPANPLYAEKTGWTASMVGFPYDSLDAWRGPYPADVWIRQFEKVAAGFADGCAKFEAALAAMAPDVRASAAKDLALFRAEQLHFRSVAAQGRFVLARDAKDVDAVKRLAREELETAKALLAFVRADSRIGYESSNHYYYTPQDVREKILSCRAILDAAR